MRKKLGKKIDADTKAVRNDLRKLRDDLVGFARSKRRRGSAEAAAAGARVREAATEVRERLARRGEYRKPRWWNLVSATRKHPTRKRRVAALLALGVAAYLLLRKLEATGDRVTVVHEEASVEEPEQVTSFSEAQE
jgi:hypothetical protein